MMPAGPAPPLGGIDLDGETEPTVEEKEAVVAMTLDALRDGRAGEGCGKGKPRKGSGK